jgi:hypothetical protein
MIRFSCWVRLKEQEGSATPSKGDGDFNFDVSVISTSATEIVS